ncbi:MAG: hypothetical protein ACRDOI_35700 [Trebonia sp.]
MTAGDPVQEMLVQVPPGAVRVDGGNVQFHADRRELLAGVRQQSVQSLGHGTGLPRGLVIGQASGI